MTSMALFKIEEFVEAKWKQSPSETLTEFATMPDRRKREFLEKKVLPEPLKIYITKIF